MSVADVLSILFHRHLEIFELVRIEDERELAVRLEAVCGCHNRELCRMVAL